MAELVPGFLDFRKKKKKKKLVDFGILDLKILDFRPLKEPVFRP